jgi:hypothetical protein
MILGTQTRILFLVSVIAISSILSCGRVLGEERDLLNVESDQTLYFQPTHSDYMYMWLMNTSMPSGQGISQQIISAEYFVSPCLAQRFTFQTITTVIYHEGILGGRGTNSLFVFFGFVDANGLQHLVASNSTTMGAGTKVSSLTIAFNMLVLEQERLYFSLSVLNSLGLAKPYIYWGNSTYPSQISYIGSAVYVPEFPSFLIPPLFIIATLLTTIVFRREHSKN